MKEISKVRGIPGAESGKVFISDVEKHYGPLLGFRQAENEFNQRAINEANEFNNLKKTNSRFAEELKSLHDRGLADHWQ